MFNNAQQLIKQLQLAQQLMKDERVRVLLAHPNVQRLMRDPEFQALVRSQDLARITAHPKFVELARDPAFASLIAALAPPPSSGQTA